MSKLFKVLVAGKYPQGDLTIADLKEIAGNYSPTYHEAPLTADHKREGSALGWVESVSVQGRCLFVIFSKISDEVKSLQKNKKYKQISVEIANYDGVGLYLRAVSLINIDSAKGNPEFPFTGLDKEATIYFSEGCELNLKQKAVSKKCTGIIEFEMRDGYDIESLQDIKDRINEQYAVTKFEVSLSEPIYTINI